MNFFCFQPLVNNFRVSCQKRAAFIWLVRTNVLLGRLLLEVELLNQSTLLLPLQHRWTKLQTLLKKNSWCLSERQFPDYANFIRFMKKYTINFFTKWSLMVTFTFSFSTFPNFIIDCQELAGSPTEVIAINLICFCGLKTYQLRILLGELKVSIRKFGFFHSRAAAIFSKVKIRQAIVYVFN